MIKKHLLLIILQILFCNYLFAQTWNGSTNTDWNTPGNWTPATVPISTASVTIPGSITKYPVLGKDVTIKSIDMQSGSQLDFNGHILNITSVSENNNITGAILNNSNGTSDIVVNLNSGGDGYSSYIKNSTVNDNITFNLSGTHAFYDADGSGTENTYNGNVNINATDVLPLNLSNGSASQFNGNLIISRTIKGGSSTLFGAGGNITGNFKFTNNLDSALLLGNLSKPTAVTGKVDIALKQATPTSFKMYNLINQMPGGSITALNTFGFDVRNNTLKVNTFNITDYQGKADKYFYNNDITGNLILNDKKTNDDGWDTELRSNVIRGNADFTMNSPNNFREGYFYVNHFTGDVTYTVNNEVMLTISGGGTGGSKYDGNLTILRAFRGNTNLFSRGVTIGGNFSYTDLTPANEEFGNTASIGDYTYLTTIGGKVDINLPFATPGFFELRKIKNGTTGGIIHVQNSLGFDVTNDTLKVSSFIITGYRGQYYSRFYNNDITGNLTLADDASYADFKGTYLRSNTIRGNSDFTNNGINTFYDADVANSGNHFIGNVNFTVTNKGILSISDAAASKYDGNLTIHRSRLGNTNLFNSGGTIGGDFTFTATAFHKTLLGNNSYPTQIGGKVNIDLNNIVHDYGSYFQLHRMINSTAGGNIRIQNSEDFEMQKDTLKVNSLNISEYLGGVFYNNDITGNLILNNNVTDGAGLPTRVRSNVIRGDANFTSTRYNFFYDADQPNSGNKYTGNVVYNKDIDGADYPGEFTVGLGDTTSIGGSLSFSSKITKGSIEFTGNRDGIIQQTDNLPIIIPTMIMNKTGTTKITLMDTLKITNSLNLLSGIIETDVNSNLILPDNITYLGGSDSSYIDGPMLKIGDDAFTFPVGQNNKYAPITITAPGTVTDQFRAQYLDKKPHDAGYDATKKDATLDHISGTEYWMLDRISGTSNVSVTLSWGENRSGGVDKMTDLRVARWNGSTWINLGKGTTTGDNKNGTIQTAAVVTSFSPFTLASITVLNPLPISISRFDAQKNKQSVLLNWTTENEINFSHFEVERADGNNHFSSIGKVSAQNGQAMEYYSFEDNQPLRGVNLYRLKLVGADGKVVLSNVRSILFNADGTITIYPNPAIDFFQIDGVPEGVTIEIHDAGGKLVKRILSSASTRYSVSDLRKGIYFIKIMDKENTTISKLIIQ